MKQPSVSVRYKDLPAFWGQNWAAQVPFASCHWKLVLGILWGKFLSPVFFFSRFTEKTSYLVTQKLQVMEDWQGILCHYIWSIHSLSTSYFHILFWNYGNVGNIVKIVMRQSRCLLRLILWDCTCRLAAVGTWAAGLCTFLWLNIWSLCAVYNYYYRVFSKCLGNNLGKAVRTQIHLSSPLTC